MTVVPVWTIVTVVTLLTVGTVVIVVTLVTVVATSTKVNHATWVSEWVTKPRNLSKHKNPATSPHKKIPQPLRKHRKNCKMLPWEDHIGCQICQIALCKSTEKVKKLRLRDFFLERLHDFSHNCPYCHCCHYCNFFFKFTFSLLLERSIWHIWQPM